VVGRIPRESQFHVQASLSAIFHASFLFFAVLDGLLSMTENNWEELSKELGEMLNAEIA